jgi:PKHD-type hydroxylase
VLLNNPSEFDGGEFEFKELLPEQQACLSQGSIIVFPAFLDHRVKPVTKGERFSAVCWASGPAFK